MANGTPVIAAKILGTRFNYPLDAGIKFLDQRPLFGPSKTIRGFVLAILVTTLTAQVLGFSWYTGTMIGFFAMLGDLVSSFAKRRMNMPPSSKAVGLDQIPESLFPLLACATTIGLNGLDIVILVVLFLLGEIVLSPILYKLNIRQKPY